MRLIIAEKPELGRAIADALFTHPETHDSVITEGDTSVIWCFGHMLSLKDPKDIEEDRSRTLEQLPIYHRDWEKVISSGKEKRTRQIGSLMKKADEIINAGDPDDEGQLLIDELIKYFNYRGTVKRVLINDNLPDKIRQAFAGLRDNRDFESLGRSANARAMADLCFGVNHSRILSATMKASMSVGRVMTPTLGLVVARDYAIENHVKQKYYDIEAVYDAGGQEAVFTFKKDDGSYVMDSQEADEIASALPESRDLSFTNAVKTSAPPLPYNQTKLQADMNKMYGYSLDETLEATQTLRDKHKAITYNRSDCQYLAEEHYKEAPEVVATALSNIGRSDLPMEYDRHSRCFNDKNVSAHHAIIPQNKHVDISSMSERERNVYISIVERYAMQFLPPETRLESKSSFKLKDGSFRYSASAVQDEGYKRYFRNDDNELVSKKQAVIPSGTYNSSLISSRKTEKYTNPPKRYTQGTLVEDMSSIAKYVTDPEIKAILKKKDEEKKGENGSIGTTATRASIVKKLLERGYLKEERKHIVSTDKARQLCKQIPDRISKPDVTARWWLIQEEIKEGRRNQNDLMMEVADEVRDMLSNEYRNIRPVETTVSADDVIGSCPLCGKNVVRRKMKNGKSFYPCSDKDCGFALFEDMKRFDDTVHITSTSAKRLLKGGKMKAKLHNRQGREYEAYLKMKINGKYVNLEIDGFPDKK